MIFWSHIVPSRANRTALFPIFLALAVLAVGQLSGCATPCQGPGCAGAPPAPAPGLMLSKKVTAVGYGSIASYSQYASGQQKLMAMRAAQLDAYRSLAEQVYGVRIASNTSVSAYATQNDSVRSYVNSFIRGARVTNTAALADGNYEVTVELDVPEYFRPCLVNGPSCSPSAG